MFRDKLIPFQRRLVQPILSHRGFQEGYGYSLKIHPQEQGFPLSPKSFLSCNRGRLDIVIPNRQSLQSFLPNRL